MNWIEGTNKMNKRKIEISLWTLILILSLVLGYITAMNFYEPFDYQKTTEFLCTGSMRPTFDCGDLGLLQNFNGTIELGQMYIYDRGDILVGHRAIDCFGNDCEFVLFKGDNNNMADVAVSKDKVKYRLMGVIYNVR